MKDIDIRAFKVYSNTNLYNSHVIQARNMIKDCDTPYVAFSGGKDSTVLLHMTHSIYPDIDAYTYMYRQVPDVYAKEIVQLCKSITGKSCIQWKPIKNKTFLQAIIQHYIPSIKSKYCTALVGLRKQESLNRKRRIMQNYNISCINECWPLQNWSADDIWAYIVSNDIPYLSHYDNRCDIEDIRDVRFSTMWHYSISRNIDTYKDYRHVYNTIQGVS